MVYLLPPITIVMSLNKRFTILFFCTSILACAFTWPRKPPDKIALALEKFRQTFPQEKVHLHLDRNYFNSGDTLNFRAYVVNAENNQFTALSKVLYVDLLNTENTSVIGLRFPLNDGGATGVLELPENLEEGTYVLRAYTNWMRNFNPAFFYNCILKISGTESSNQGTISNGKLVKPSDDLHDIQFFPEGGNLVNQLTSVIAFKAVNKFGKGEDVLGTIVDENDRIITNFQSAFAGMGRFSFKPRLNHHYQAIAKFQDGSVKKIALPPTLNSGYVMTINNQHKNELIVKVKCNGLQDPGSVLLVAQANNILINSTEVKLVGESATLSFSKQLFPMGIVQLRLFDKLAQPMAERLFFSERNTQLRLNLAIEKTPLDNGLVKITLEATDELLNPVSGNFSIAVTNGNELFHSDLATAPSILSDLLLTEDLNGNVENPDHYFQTKSPQVNSELDNLMLTQGWRRFIWQNLLSEKLPQITYKVEKEQSLSGWVKTTNGLPASKQNILLMAKGDSAFTIHSATDDNGRFVFDLPDLEGEQQLSILTSKGTGHQDLKIILDEFAPAAPGNMLNIAPQTEALKRQPTQRSQSQANGLPKGRSRQLKEVVVKSKKITVIDKAVTGSGNFNGAGNADQIITYKDLSQCTDLAMCLQGKLIGIMLKQVFDKKTGELKVIPYSVSGGNNPMLFVLDGVPIQPGQLTLSSIPAKDVQSIEVLRTGGRLAVYGFAGSGGVLVITTKKGGIDYNEAGEPASTPASASSGVIHPLYSGYKKTREFYVPTYITPDLKTNITPATILWKPLVQTNDEGKAVLEVPVGINVKNIVIVAEGISADGKIGYKFKKEVIK